MTKTQKRINRIMSIMLVFMISFSSIYVYAADDEEEGGNGSGSEEISDSEYENEGIPKPTPVTVDATTEYNAGKIIEKICQQSGIIIDTDFSIGALITAFNLGNPVFTVTSSNMTALFKYLYSHGYFYTGSDGRVHLGSGSSGPSSHSNTHSSAAEVNNALVAYNDFQQLVASLVRTGLDSVPVEYQGSLLTQYYVKWGLVQTYYNNGDCDNEDAKNCASAFLVWIKQYIEYDPDTGVYTLMPTLAQSVSENLTFDLGTGQGGLQEFPFDTSNSDMLSLMAYSMYFGSFEDGPDYFKYYAPDENYYQEPFFVIGWERYDYPTWSSSYCSGSGTPVIICRNDSSWNSPTIYFSDFTIQNNHLVVSDYVEAYDSRCYKMFSNIYYCEPYSPSSYHIWDWGRPKFQTVVSGLSHYPGFFGNTLIIDGHHIYGYINSTWYDFGNQLDEHNISLTGADGNPIEFNFNQGDKNYTNIDIDKLLDLNMKLFDDLNTNFSLNMEDLWKLFDELTIKIMNGLSEGKDYEDLLRELKEYLINMNEHMENIEGDLDGIAGGIGDIIYWLKKIDTKCKNIDKKIDTFLSSWNPFTVLFENKMDELIAAVSGNGGTASGNSIINNNGDVITNTYNLLFTMNEEQQNDIDIEINKIKAPLNWAFDFSDNASDFLNKFENRAAMYSSGNRIGSKNIFNKYNAASGNSVNNDSDIEPDSEISADAGNGGGIRDDAGIPCIYMDFSNATSDIDYGGKVKVLKFDWYMPYKPYVDYVIVIFCWAFALWKIWKALPSIISGVSSAIDNSDK